MTFLKSNAKLLIVIIGFPIAYILFSLSPISYELFVNRNESFYFPFWIGIVLLHWITFYFVYVFLKKDKRTFSDIGYKLNKKQTLLLIIGFVSLGLILFGFTEYAVNNSVIDQGKQDKLSTYFPKTTGQRLFFILAAFSAGFCEEIIYRGYAITQLSKLGLNKWLAIIPAGVAFVFIHGINGYTQFWFYFTFALAMGILFVLSKRLIVNIIIHSVFDLMMVMVIFQAINY